MIKTFIIISLLFHCFNCNFMPCLTQVLSTGSNPCKNKPVCSVRCSEILGNSYVGVCEGELLHFEVPEPDFLQVCLYKNYGNDVDIDLSKQIIEKETGIYKNVEGTDLYQEFMFRLKFYRLKEFCREQPNSYVSELQAFHAEEKSAKTKNRLARIARAGQNYILKKLYFFISSGNCKCTSFEDFYTNPVELERKRKNLIKQCLKRYPNCYKKTKIPQLRGESDNAWNIKTSVMYRHYHYHFLPSAVKKLNTEKISDQYFKQAVKDADYLNKPNPVVKCKNKQCTQAEINAKKRGIQSRKQTYENFGDMNAYKTAQRNYENAKNKMLRYEKTVWKDATWNNLGLPDYISSCAGGSCPRPQTVACCAKYNPPLDIHLNTYKIPKWNTRRVCEWRFNDVDCIQQVCHIEVGYFLTNQYKVRINEHEFWSAETMYVADRILARSNLEILPKQICGTGRQVYAQEDLWVSQDVTHPNKILSSMSKITFRVEITRPADNILNYYKGYWPFIRITKIQKKNLGKSEVSFGLTKLTQHYGWHGGVSIGNPSEAWRNGVNKNIPVPSKSLSLTFNGDYTRDSLYTFRMFEFDDLTVLRDFNGQYAWQCSIDRWDIKNRLTGEYYLQKNKLAEKYFLRNVELASKRNGLLNVKPILTRHLTRVGQKLDAFARKYAGSLPSYLSKGKTYILALRPSQSDMNRFLKEYSAYYHVVHSKRVKTHILAKFEEVLNGFYLKIVEEVENFDLEWAEYLKEKRERDLKARRARDLKARRARYLRARRARYLRARRARYLRARRARYLRARRARLRRILDLSDEETTLDWEEEEYI